MTLQASFWSELKRRNVLRAGLAWLALSWLLIAIADLLFPYLDFPDEAIRDQFRAVARVTGDVDALVAWAREDVDNIAGYSWLSEPWQPSLRAFREAPGFFEVAIDVGLVALWEQRGYPPGCEPVDGPDGRHLDCSEFPG